MNRRVVRALVFMVVIAARQEAVVLHERQRVRLLNRMNHILF